MAIVNTHYGYCGSRVPTLAGSWLFKEVLTKPSTQIDEAVNFTATGGGAARTCTAIKTLTNKLNYVYNAGGLQRILAVYDFDKNEWVSGYKTITFAEDATVSEEFMSWLVANATKQR